MRIFYKIILSLFLCLAFLSFQRADVFAAQGQAGAGGGTLNADGSGNLSIGGTSTSTAKFQVVPLSSNTYGFKVVDSGNGSLFTVTTSGVATFASSTTISGSATLNGSAKFSALLGSAGQCLSTNASGVLSLVTCGSAGATSTAASLITSAPGTFNSLAGTGGNYYFPALLSVHSGVLPASGNLYVNGNVGVNKSNPATALDVTGTVTATAFAGGGAGVTGVTAAAVPWTGVSSKPTTVLGYGITDIYSWAQQLAKPSYAFSEVTSTLSDAQVPDNITINTAGTVTAGQFVGGGAGLTGVIASDASKVAKTGDTMTGGLTVPSLSFTGVGGDSGQPPPTSDYRIYQAPGAWISPYPDLNIAYHTGIKFGAASGYGGTRIYNNADMATELFSVGNGDNNVRVDNNLYVSGTTTAAQFVGGGASVTGVTAASAAWTGISGRPTALSAFDNQFTSFITANQTITLSGAVTGSGATAIGTTLGVSPYYPVTAGNGYGICFWNDCTNYKIHMGSAAEYWYGPVGDYAIKTNMSNTAGRGWTWGVTGVAPVAAINTAGAMRVAGTFTSGSQYISSNGNFAGRTYDDWYNLQAGTMGAWGAVYAYTAICTGNASGACSGASGVVLGLTNASASVNIPNSGTVFFNNGYGVSVGQYLNSSALDVVGTVTATSFTGSGSGLTGVTQTKYWSLTGGNDNGVAAQEYLNWNAQNGAPTIAAADMIPGRIIRIHATGSMRNVYYWSQTNYIIFRLDWGAGNPFGTTYSRLIADSIDRAFDVEMILAFTSATNFKGVMRITIVNPAFGAVVTEKYVDYTFAAGSVTPQFWTYQAFNQTDLMASRMLQSTIEYLN